MTKTGRQLARELYARDNIRSLALVAAMLLLSGLVVYWLLGVVGLLIASALVAASSLLSANGQLLLRMQRAQPLTHSNAPGVIQLLERLAHRANVAAPHLYWLPSSTPNALATETRDGRGALALTQGLLMRLSYDELEGVMAHEISHIRSGDTRRVRCIAAANQTTTTLLNVAVWFGLFSTLVSGEGFGAWLVLLLLSWVVPLAFGALQLALSRTREYAADTSAVELTGRPLSLASALAKLEGANAPWLRRVLGRSARSAWLDSHPDTHSRVTRLRALGTTGLPLYGEAMRGRRPRLARVGSERARETQGASVHATAAVQRTAMAVGLDHVSVNQHPTSGAHPQAEQQERVCPYSSR